MALLPKRKKSETLKERIRRHIYDKNDVITDEDIRDAVAGEAVPKETTTETPLTKEEKIEAKKMEEEIPENKKKTPWDILSED